MSTELTEAQAAGYGAELRQLDEAVDAAIAADATMPAWNVTTSLKPPEEPVIIHIHRLLLAAGGLEVTIDDEYYTRIAFLHVTREALTFDSNAPIDQCAAEIPARLLPILRAAVSDLERMVAQKAEVAS